MLWNLVFKLNRSILPVSRALPSYHYATGFTYFKNSDIIVSFLMRIKYYFKKVKKSVTLKDNTIWSTQSWFYTKSPIRNNKNVSLKQTKKDSTAK